MVTMNILAGFDDQTNQGSSLWTVAHINPLNVNCLFILILCVCVSGSLLFNPINAWLVTRFTWRVAFRFSSILILGLGVACCWTFSSKDEPGHQQFQNEDGKEM